MGDSESDPLSVSGILCEESDSCFNIEEEKDLILGADLKHNPCFVFEENEDEYIEKLFLREITHGSKNSPSTSQSCLRNARLDAIEWILNTREILGFHLQTAYLSITYLDQFLSKRSVDDNKLWVVRLLSVASLSVAAKMEECNVPVLSEFAVPDYNFESEVIQRMELLVLKTLEWKMCSITPFAYLHYFINKFHTESRPKVLMSRVMELVIAVIKEINSMDSRPSSIAAAAVLAASDFNLTRKSMELELNVISSLVEIIEEAEHYVKTLSRHQHLRKTAFFFSQGHVFSCYKLMQEIEMGKFKTPKSEIYPNKLPIHRSSTDTLEDSYLISGAGTKRKLAFNEPGGQNCAKKKIHPPQ